MFDALYGPAARVYDPFTDWLFLGEWERWQETTLALLPTTGMVVELGAGTGRLARCGAGSGRVWLGVERSAAMLAVAKRRAAVGEAWFVRATAGAVPVADGVVDAVVATFPAPYIVEEATASEVRRIVKPGGRVIVVLSGELAAHGFARRVRRAALRLFYGRAAGGGEPFSVKGLVGEVRAVTTRHGVAAVYVGTVVKSGG